MDVILQMRNAPRTVVDVKPTPKNEGYRSKYRCNYAKGNEKVEALVNELIDHLFGVGPERSEHG